MTQFFIQPNSNFRTLINNHMLKANTVTGKGMDYNIPEIQMRKSREITVYNICYDMQKRRFSNAVFTMYNIET